MTRRRQIVQGVLATFALARSRGMARADTIVIENNHVFINGREVGGTGAVEAEGPEQTEHRSPGRYAGIDLAAPADLRFTEAPETSLTITAPANILPLVTTELHGDVLVIGLRGSVVMHGPIHIDATSPSLAALRISGSGSAAATGLTGPGLGLAISGSGSVLASGSVRHVDVRISGSGNADLGGLRAEDVTAAISGSGSIWAYASERARADIAGSGDIVIAGDPRERSAHRSGSGRIVFR